MKFKKIVFVLCLASILILFFISNYFDKPMKGIVESVEILGGRSIIKLTSGESLVIFENKLLEIKEGDEILFWGKENIYQGDRQIIVEKIAKIN